MKEVIVRLKEKWKNKKGSYIVEACIILPIVLLGILTLGSLSKSYYWDFKIKTQLDDEMRLTMGASYFDDKGKGLPFRVRNRIGSEVEGEKQSVENFRIEDYRYDFTECGYNSLIALETKYKKNLHIPLIGDYNGYGSEKTLARMFVGDKERRQKFPFDEMEKNEDTKIVYIFPLDGKRYHRERCSYVVPKATELSVREIDKSKVKPCPICKSKNLKGNDRIYVFNGYGDYYHRGACRTVTKNIEKMTVEKAKEKGYTPCSKCNP